MLEEESAGFHPCQLLSSLLTPASDSCLCTFSGVGQSKMLLCSTQSMQSRPGNGNEFNFSLPVISEFRNCQKPTPEVAMEEPEKLLSLEGSEWNDVQWKTSAHSSTL